MTDNKREKYIAALKRNVGERRLHHCICVAKEAVKLARKLGADEEKAETAGLLHDIMKERPIEYVRMLIEQRRPLTGFEEIAVQVLHAPAGAEYVQQELGIEDEEVLNAIRYHCTARAGMTLLEKIIYIGDFTSEDRKFDDIDLLRKLTYENINDGMRYTLQYTIAHNIKKRQLLIPDTVEAYNELLLAAMKA